LSLVRGSIETTSLPALLRPLIRERRTGVLRLNRGAVTKTIYVSGGRLIFATSTDPDDRLGEMLLTKGVITYRNLEESVLAIKIGKRQGTILVESGAIRSRDLISGVTEQVQEIVYSVFRWDIGTFEFVEGDLPSREVIVLRMSTGDLLMEGIRRISAWSRIRGGVGPLDQRYALAHDYRTLLAGLVLEKHELGLVATLAGEATVEEICAANALSDFLVCRTIWGLWAAGVLDRVPEDRQIDGATPVPVAEVSDKGRAASVGREIDLFNELHRLVFDLVTYQLRDGAQGFFEKALAQIRSEWGAVFEGVTLDGTGSLNAVTLRRNIVMGEIGAYSRGLGRLLEIEAAQVKTALGEKKAAIIQDGLIALREQQMQKAAPRT
jgi:Domain of unknown function (DUF4388)